MKKATIVIPEEINGMDCQTDDIHPIILINALNMLLKHFARELIAEAKKNVGNNPKLQEQYLDRLTKKYLGDNPGNLKIDPNSFN